MKKLKKILRISGLILLMMIAGLGIGMSGGVTIPRPQKKEDTIEIVISKEETDEEANEDDIP